MEIEDNKDNELPSDWNLLGKLVGEIEAIRSQRWGRFIVTIKDDCCSIQATNRTKEGTYSKSYCSGDKFNSVDKSVKMFFEWYNKDKNKK